MRERTRIPGVSNHARYRAGERFGRDFSPSEWRAVLLDIVDGRSTIIMRQGDGSEIRLVQVGTVAIKVVWQPVQALIITILPDCPAASPQAESARRAPLVKARKNGGFYLGGKFRPPRTKWEGQP